jgi:hypothetical protein
VWFYAAAGRDAVVGVVVEADGLAVAADGGEGGQEFWVEGGCRGVAWDGFDVLQGGDAVAQAGGQDLFEFEQGAQGDFFEAGDVVGAQGGGDGDGFVVVEQQWWEFGAGAEAVAAEGAGGGVDGVAELAQAVDVAAHGALADLELLGEFAALPVAAGLQEGEQAQQAGRRFQHDPDFRTEGGRNAF